MTSHYKRPLVGDNNVVYKGRRFWVVELTGKDPVQWIDHMDADYIMYDCLYDAVNAVIKKLSNGKYEASLMSHVEILCEFDTLEEAIKQIPIHYEDYIKST
jgi:hypothetical protein